MMEMKGAQIFNFLNKLQFTLRRRSGIARCPHLFWATGLKLAFSRHLNTSKSVLPLIRTTKDGQFRVEFAGFIFEVPCPEGIESQITVREHFSQVLAETFISPLFFHGDVSLQSGNTVLDLGGNIGTTAALFSQVVGSGGKVYAFEPSVPNVLEHNRVLNSGSNVEVISVAVSDRIGTSKMSMGPSGMDSTIVKNLDWHSRAKEIPTVTLDHFIEEKKISRVDYIKMDIEGAEESAIRGAIRLIRRDRPKWSISSYHTDFVGEKQHSKLVQLLGSLDYEVKEIPGFHIFASPRNKRRVS